MRDGVARTIAQFHLATSVLLSIMCLESRDHAGTNIWLILHTDTVKAVRNLMSLSLPPRETVIELHKLLWWEGISLLFQLTRETLKKGPPKKSCSAVESHGKVSPPESQYNLKPLGQINWLCVMLR